MPDSPRCKEPGCQGVVHAKGLCQACYRRAIRHAEKERRETVRQIYFEHISRVRKDSIGVDSGIVKSRLAGLAISVLQNRASVDLREWLERNITLPIGNGFHQQRKLNFDLFPHMKYILSLVDNPGCKRIVLCFAAQSGKSDTVASIAAYLSGYRNRRGIYVLPTATMFDKVRDTRLFPLLDASRNNVGFDYVENRNTFRFSNGIFFYLALASSPGTLAEQTGTSWVIVDELDEFKQEGKGHNPVDLAEKRMQTSQRRLTIIACTPKRTGVGYTYSYYNRTKRFIEEIQCPFCSGWFIPNFHEHFKWPENMEPAAIEDGNMAWVECPECGGMIMDDMHYFIVTRRKRWKDLDPDLPLSECGFRLPIFLTPNKNWSATAAAYLSSLADPYSEADFNNSWLAKPKEENDALRTGDMDFDRLKGDWRCERNEIPDGVYRLSAGVDVGISKIWFVLLGWGKEKRNYVIRSEGIDRDIGLGSESLSAAMATVMEMCNPANYRARGRVPEFSGGFIDSGDGNDTETVYEYCRENFAFRPSKGYTEMTDLWKQSWADRDDKKYRGRYKGLPLYLVNTNSMQNLIRVCMRNSPGSPKSIQFAEDAPDILFQHIRNQRQYEIRRRGRMFLRWGKVRDKDDHLLDALMQAMFAGHAMGLHTVDFEAPPPPSQTTQPSRRIVLAGNLNGRS